MDKNNFFETFKINKSNHFISLMPPINNLGFSIQTSMLYTFQNLKYGVFPEDVKLIQIVQELIDQKTIQCEDPLEVIINLEKDTLPKGTVNKILEIDKSMDSILSEHIYNSNNNILNSVSVL